MNLLTIAEKHYSEQEYKEAKSEYDTCNHIKVCTGVVIGKYFTGDKHMYYGCVKCGLNTKIKDERKLVGSKQRIMYDYLDSRFYEQGIDTGIICDFSLACAIYSKIKEAHPEVTDEQAIKYLIMALVEIKTIVIEGKMAEPIPEIHDEKISKYLVQMEKDNDGKIDVAKELSLSPRFNRWLSEDVYEYSKCPLVKRFPG